MATNQMRREAAKRKLARQQERRVQQAKRRRQIAVVASAAAVVVIVVGVVLVSTLGRGGDGSTTAADAPDEPRPAQVSCAYPAEADPAKPNQPPPTEGVTTQGTVSVALTTSAGPIGLTLEPGKAPCTVNSLVSLVSQKYFDATPCHRLTTSPSLQVLQCGDPTGSGQGGPGYTIVDEPPTDLVPADGGAVVYPRGTLAMAKTAAPDSGGSQFFLVYADSMLPPEYTVFGTIDDAGLATLDAIAAAGSDNSDGQGDGAPVTPVTIQTATLA